MSTFQGERDGGRAKSLGGLSKRNEIKMEAAAFSG